MIHTRLNDLLRIVLNEADEQMSLTELTKASEDTRKLAHQGYGVIWDFRKLNISECDKEVLDAIQSKMRNMSKEVVPQKRAILVTTTQERDVLDAFIGSTSIGWPWGVFMEFGLALQWLND